MPPQPIRLADAFARFDTHWDPKIVAELNGQHVKLAKIEGEFVWHAHADEDELFLVVKGRLEMQFRDGSCALDEGDLIVVPRGVEHCPRAEGEAWILLFEPATTINTGDAGGERTVAAPERLAAAVAETDVRATAGDRRRDCETPAARDAGFVERAHTADWELEVWAPDLAGLIEQAAAGMYALMGVELDDRRRVRRRVEVEGADREDLLVAALTELLYLTEAEGVGVDVVRAAVGERRAELEVEGAPVRAQAKEIKAVTYHRLEIEDGDEGVRTRIVFDV